MRQLFKLRTQVILLVFTLILFSSFVSSEAQVNYFRGDSLKETVDSVEYYAISDLPPTDSTTTTISVTTTQGINER